MTTEKIDNDKQAVREEIIEAVPEIMELKFGCLAVHKKRNNKRSKELLIEAIAMT